VLKLVFQAMLRTQVHLGASAAGPILLRATGRRASRRIPVPPAGNSQPGRRTAKDSPASMPTPASRWLRRTQIEGGTNQKVIPETPSNEIAARVSAAPASLPPIARDASVATSAFPQAIRLAGQRYGILRTKIPHERTPALYSPPPHGASTSCTRAGRDCSSDEYAAPSQFAAATSASRSNTHAGANCRPHVNAIGS